MIKAVLWDFGGVFTTSPFEAFARFERAHNLPKDFIRTINSTNPDTNAWAQFESSAIDVDGFDTAFRAEAEALGHSVRGKDVLELLSGEFRPRMVAALATCKAHYKVGCITNNMKRAGEGPAMAATDERAQTATRVMAQFDIVVESSVEGVRKPNPRIYQIACERLGVRPKEAVFLDDLGINLKPARAMGMTTIKVVDEGQALDELGAATGLSFS
ncbi:MAG: HAD-IA family hydrolase [Gammaproteobacteria bacterium]|nr:HAD-IA family hydrolase [Gammaproteobacteria bacterium]